MCKSFECKTDVMVKLYKTLVRPIVEYNIVIWGPSYTLDNQKLERIQHKAIPFIRHLSYYNRLRHHLYNTVDERGDLIYLYQILKGSYDIDNHLFTPSRVHNIKTHGSVSCGLRSRRATPVSILTGRKKMQFSHLLSSVLP